MTEENKNNGESLPQFNGREDVRTEFKEIWGNRSLAAIAAFANTQGGVLYIGINDAGGIVGIDKIDASDDKTIRHYTDIVRQNLPEVRFDIEFQYKTGVQFLAITVKPSPKLIKFAKVYYKRIGAEVCVMNDLDLSVWGAERAKLFPVQFSEYILSQEERKKTFKKEFGLNCRQYYDAIIKRQKEIDSEAFSKALEVLYEATCESDAFFVDNGFGFANNGKFNFFLIEPNAERPPLYYSAFMTESNQTGNRIIFFLNDNEYRFIELYDEKMECSRNRYFMVTDKGKHFLRYCRAIGEYHQNPVTFD